MSDFELQDKKVLVTGATGFIGSHVTQMLLKQGVDVRAMARDPAKAAPLEKLGAEIALADMTDPSSLQRAVEGCRVVFHFAGLVVAFEPWSYYHLINVEGTRLLAEAALAAEVERFFYTSSAWVYGMFAGLNIDEDSPLVTSQDAYSDTKLEAELAIRQLIEERGLPGVIIQPSEVYGPNDPNWTMMPIRMIQSRMLLLLNGGQGIFHPIYIDDVVEGVLAAAAKGTIGQAYILCGVEPATFREYFGYLARMLGRERLPSVPGRMAMAMAALAEGTAKLLRRPPLFTRQVARAIMKYAAYNGEKARHELGFVPQIALDEGMRRVEEWLQAKM